jgi:hypothetical protein
MKKVIILFFIFISNCCYNNKIIINKLKRKNVSLRVCNSFNVAISNIFDLFIIEDILNAIEYWNFVLEKEVFIFNNGDFKNVIFINLDDTRDKENPSRIGYIFIDSDINGCVFSTVMKVDKNIVAKRPYSAESIIRHELGHFLGLAHTKDNKTINVMNSIIIRNKKYHPLKANKKQIEYLKRITIIK